MLRTIRKKVIKHGREHPNKRHDIGVSRIPTEDLSFHTCEVSKPIGYSAPYFRNTEGPVVYTLFPNIFEIGWLSRLSISVIP